MTAPQILSLALLGVCLVVAVWRHINIGILALSSALVVVVVAHADVTKMYTAFPGNLFTLIAGVSLMFAHLERSGAIQALVGTVYRAIGGRTVLLPWAGFVIAAALSTMGAFSTAPIALLVPVIAYVSTRAPRSFFVNELAVVIAANCAGLSPLNPTGAAVHTALSKTNTAYSTWGLWAISVVIAVIAVAALQGLEAVRQRRGGTQLRPAALDLADEGAATMESHPANRAYAICSGVALLLFVVVVVFLQWDIGLTSMAAALILVVVFRPNEKQLIARVPWNAILLLCGLLTYLGLIQQIGTMDAIQKQLTTIPSHLLLVLVLAYITAVLCNIESSTLGVLTLMAPIVGSTLGASPGILWIIAAVAVPAALTVMNPVHVAGTLIIANTAEEQQPSAFNRLLAVSLACTALVPGIVSIIAVTAGTS